MITGEVGAQGIERPTPVTMTRLVRSKNDRDAHRSQPSHVDARNADTACVLDSCLRNCAVPEIPALSFELGLPL